MSHAAQEAAQSSVTYWDPTIGYYTFTDPAAGSSVATQVAAAYGAGFLAQKGVEYKVQQGVGQALGHEKEKKEEKYSY
jgi:hypothetical protein